MNGYNYFPNSFLSCLGLHLPGLSAVAIPDSKRELFRQSCGKILYDKPLEVNGSPCNVGSYKGPGS